MALSSDSRSSASSEPFKPGFTVVGIGASAGGLQALRAFLEHTPPTSGIVWVVVVHLSPEHESLLADLLQPVTSMPVIQVTEDTHLHRNHVYVIPPGRNLSSIDTSLRLSSLESSRRERAPIDHFLRTLGSTHKECAVGVILTGTGTDGTRGIKEIKEHGGITVVQDPAEAEFDGMPRSAISTGMVNKVLPLARIPDWIARIDEVKPEVEVPEDSDGDPSDDPTDDGLDILHKIYAEVQDRSGHDFSRYRRSTMSRRIRRRMQIHQIEQPGRYLEKLRQEPDEVRALFDDLLITVTSFFRDRDVFEILEKQVIPKLFANKGPSDQVRVWTVGCATGEEAYSIAMLLLEQASQMERPPQIQVFASDLHQPSLNRAREGFYPESIEADLGKKRLERFFNEENGGYRVRQEVRKSIVFAPHSLLKDPPFSRVDLISCRNVLIYLERRVQREVMSLFHYALRADGFLLLGTSETVERTELFRPLHKKSAIYQRRNVGRVEPRLPAFPVFPGSGRPRGAAGLPPEGTLSYGAAHQRMLELHGPQSILLNEAQDIVQYSARAGRYLHQPGGEPTNNVLKRVREELRIELRATLFNACENRAPARSNPVQMRIEGETRQVVLQVVPASEPELDGFQLIVFEEVAEPIRPVNSAEPSSETLHELESEIDCTRKRLQVVIEEYETGQEEMWASNEELQSANEELRSTMEELETSKEELQSMNEELSTLNQENRHKVEELSQLTSDLQNLMGSTEIATLFLDRELRILRFTPRVSELFNVRQPDRGRLLSDFTHRLGYAGLLDDARKVLQRLSPIERDIQSMDGQWYLMRVLPYRTVDDRIEGVVITLVDITALKAAEQALRQAVEETKRQAANAEEGRRMLEAILHNVPEGVAIADGDEVRIRRVSHYGAALVGRSREALEGLVLGSKAEGFGFLHPEDSRRPADEELPLIRAARQGEVITSEEWLLQRPDGQTVPVLCNAGPIREGGGRITGGVLAWRDITHLKQAMEDLRARERELEALAQSLEQRVQERTEQVRTLASTLTLAEQQERRRISQILHDDLQQVLYGLEMRMSMLLRDGEKSGLDEVARTAQSAREWIGRAIQTTRQLTVNLSPPVLKDEGMVETLQWLASQVKRLHNLDVEIEAASKLRIPDEDMRVLLFQAVRELLFNVVKHAGVKQASIAIAEEGGQLVVTVRDSGKGFDQAPQAEGHRNNSFGLYSVQERLRLFGGDMEVHSALGEGTVVTLRAPLEPGRAPGGSSPPA